VISQRIQHCYAGLWLGILLSEREEIVGIDISTVPFLNAVTNKKICEQFTALIECPKKLGTLWPETMREWSPFQKKVIEALLKVEPGKTISYADLAVSAGYPGAARAVGSVMSKNRFPILIPCHRVIYR